MGTDPGIPHMEREEKGQLLPIVLSLIVRGMVQMYCRKVGRGMLILAQVGLLGMISFVPLFFIADPSGFNLAGSIALNAVIGISALIACVWHSCDAYRCAEVHDRAPPIRYRSNLYVH